MTTSNMEKFKPDVWMIRIKNSPLSNYYKKMSTHTWKREGFKVKYFDAITPKSIPGYEELNFAQTKRKNARGKYFSKTEISVWYSHYILWHFCAYNFKPIIIAEHDALLINKIPDHVFEKQIVCLGYDTTLTFLNYRTNRNTCVKSFGAGYAYYLTPKIASMMYESHSNPGATNIVNNSDGIIHKFQDHYGERHFCVTPLVDHTKGNTIYHPRGTKGSSIVEENEKVNISSKSRKTI